MRILLPCRDVTIEFIFYYKNIIKRVVNRSRSGWNLDLESQLIIKHFPFFSQNKCTHFFSNLVARTISCNSLKFISMESWNHSLEKTSKIMKSNHPPNTTMPTKPYSESATSTCFLNTSGDGDSATSLDSLFQCLTTPSVKKFFLISNLNLP